MFYSLALILILGCLGGLLFAKINLPKLIWYLVLGILLGPSLLNLLDSSLLELSSILRQIALVIILTRSGLSIKLDSLKQIGRPAILMCFVPACFEIVGIILFGPLILNISIVEALLLGSVLAAVSPAVIVPRMIKLLEEGYGTKNHVPELILAGASCDDIFVVVLFYAFKGFVATSSFEVMDIIFIPVSIILGIALGLCLGLVLVILYRKVKMPIVVKTLILLGVSLGMLAIEEVLKPYIAISALLGIIVLGIIILRFLTEDAKLIQQEYNQLWSFFEIILFVLVGEATNIEYALSLDGLKIIGIILIALIFRSLGVVICIIKTSYTFKEKMFIIISYLPKATVQASIGGIALSEGLACGTVILTAAVWAILITAPIGAILIDKLAKKWLVQDQLLQGESCI